MAEEPKSSGSQEPEQEETLTLTLHEMLATEDDDVIAVLGAANEKSCSYVEGYMKRQALYSCLTCVPEAKEDASKAIGVCLGCSYHCHDGHELIELYTKRNFRCDCGNGKVEGLTCNLCPEKDAVNEENQYNQNFSGAYCVCHRPYPDAEDPIPDEMVQCIICEDWFHERHLGTAVPSSFAEMICQSCVAKHEFLLHYEKHCITIIEKTEEKSLVEVESSDSSKETPSSTTTCKKPQEKSEQICTKFWLYDTWRKELCICDECLKIYEDEDVTFLLDDEDPVHLYEEKGKAKNKQLVEDESRKFFNSMNRVQQIELVAGFNDFKENLSEYLKKFADSEKVIKVEDIKEFFDGMQARKKQKMDMSYYCR